MTAIYSTIDNIEVMSERRKDCQLALVEVLAKRSKHHPASPKFWEEVNQFRFLCIPTAETLNKVKILEDHAIWSKGMFESVDITLFKIPRHVNDVESYVTMLLREHFKEQ